MNITQLLYADDVISFSKGFSKGMEEIHKLLSIFSIATSQQFNLSKSQIFFNHTAQSDFKSVVCTSLQIPEAQDSSLSLVLPLPLAGVKLDFSSILSLELSTRPTTGEVEISLELVN